MNMMMDFIEKQNYPRWICGVREDNVISQRKILQWKSKEGKGYEYTPWNDGTYRSGHKRLAMEADFGVKCLTRYGEVAEWLNALVLKTSIRASYRGFESLPLRQ